MFFLFRMFIHSFSRSQWLFAFSTKWKTNNSTFIWFFSSRNLINELEVINIRTVFIFILCIFRHHYSKQNYIPMYIVRHILTHCWPELTTEQEKIIKVNEWSQTYCDTAFVVWDTHLNPYWIIWAIVLSLKEHY